MITIKAVFEDGNTIVTRWNRSIEEASSYYIGNSFTFWSNEGEKQVKCTSVSIA